MDKDRIAGSAKDFAGKVEGDVGCTAGDAKTQASGLVRQVEGLLQNLYGQAEDAYENSAVAKKVEDNPLCDPRPAAKKKMSNAPKGQNADTFRPRSICGWRQENDAPRAERYAVDFIGVGPCHGCDAWGSPVSLALNALSSLSRWGRFFGTGGGHSPEQNSHWEPFCG
jgi:uncharacterized protein YjbJ (UPF0337 family)